jgi:hypothetical protein
MFEEIVNDTKNFTNFDTTLRYLDNMYALMEFERDTTWLVTGDASDALYQNYYATRMASNLGRMCAISKSYAEEDFATLSQENAAIVCNCHRENNIKQVNTVFLDTWATDTYSFDATTEQFLQNLACSDALDNGPGVYSARVLLGFFAACDNGYVKSSVATPQFESSLTSAIEFSVYPNPSDKEVYLNYTFAEELTNVELLVYDITGKLISKQVLSNETDVVLINNQEIENGIYIYSIVAEGNLLGTGRFVIK